MNASAEVSLCPLPSLRMLRVICVLVMHTFKLEHKCLTELEASLKASTISQVFVTCFSELEYLVKLGYVASNI